MVFCSRSQLSKSNGIGFSLTLQKSPQSYGRIGVPLTSEKLVGLARKIANHSLIVKYSETMYNSIAEVKTKLFAIKKDLQQAC
jgi:hypothetical protein